MSITCYDTLHPDLEPAYLDPQRLHFEREGDTLSLTVAGAVYFPRVSLRSCFPVSDKYGYLTVHDASFEEQPEIGIVADWTQLTGVDREAVAQELGMHYFVPQIQQVFKIREEMGFLYWLVHTDRGTREFTMRHNVIRCVREISPGHWLLIDVNESRYEITNVDALDRRSSRLVRQFLYL